MPWAPALLAQVDAFLDAESLLNLWLIGIVYQHLLRVGDA